MKNSIKLIILCSLVTLSVSSLAEAKKLNKPFSVISSDQKTGKISLAEAKPMTPFSDTRLILFQYDTNLTYPIKSREGLYTHIVIDEGDKITGFYPSDTLRWKYHVSGDKKRIFIKPTTSGLFTSATLVTAKRSYEITLTSMPVSGDWYQRITWSYPAEEVNDKEVMDGQALGIYEEPIPILPIAKNNSNDSSNSNDLDLSTKQNPFKSLNQENGSNVLDNINPQDLHFNYTISGEAPFKPTHVFDDGKFVWLRFDKTLQDIPAVFMLEKDGNVKLLNYTLHGDYILISRMVDGVMLKLGDQEIKIIRDSKKCGFFGCK